MFDFGFPEAEPETEILVQGTFRGKVLRENDESGMGQVAELTELWS